MAAIKAYAWRLRDGETKRFKFRAQVENVDGRNNPKVMKAFRGWNPSGWCFPVASREDYHLYFTNEFPSYYEFYEWAKKFPYQLKELSSTSNVEKPVKLGVDSKTKSKRGRPKKVTAAKAKTRQNICGHCGDKGHNRRTCPILKKKGK